MDNLLDGLNAAQKSAVTSPASVLQVLAPPGSGKTKTLTARVAYLVNHERLQPWNIIVCTFTIKAAREMKERIQGFVGDGIEAKLILGTFHSVARRFLVRYGQEIGISKNFGIADSSDSISIIKRIVARQKYMVEPSHARSRISGLKAKGISAVEFASTTKKADQHEFSCVYTEYEDTLQASNLLDYDDLLLRCVELLRRHPACVSTIEAVLIDEYQDTNNVQYDLMKLFAQRMKRITIVGDPDQSIYSFRSAEIKNLLRMRDDYPESIVINLENNYRSSGCILSSSMAVIEQDDSRPNKPLLATHCVGEQPTLRHLATKDLEAQWIIQEIHRSKTLTAGLLSFNDYAILLRSSTLSLAIERMLGKAGIPYRMVGGTRFFDRAEIKIVLDYLRVINQPEHNDALTRIINVPSRMIGDVTVKALLEEAESKKVSVWKLILDYAQGRSRPQSKISSQAQKGIDSFVNLVLTSRKKLLPEDGEQCDVWDLINHVLQKISFQAYLRKTHKDNWEERWENVEELGVQASQITSAMAEGKIADDTLPEVEGIEQRADTAADVLSKFLANVALSAEVQRPDGEQLNQVTISTIHAAKGLEWPIVFIPAIYDGSIPHSRAEDHDEERRLLYVGMTRAQGLLYLSCPVKLSKQEETTLSKFISPRDIQKLFSKRGPSIGCAVIQDLAQILRRPCPPATDVTTARNLLERIEDDRYPLNREEIDGEESQWYSSRSNEGRQPPPKKRKIGDSGNVSGAILPVTMQNSSGFSVATTTLHNGNGGFTSARDLKAVQDEAEAVRMLAIAKTASLRKVAYDVVQTTEPKTTQKKPIKPRATGQGSITSFFSRPGRTASEKPEPSTRKVPSLQRSQSSQSKHSPLVDISNFPQGLSQPIRPYQTPSLSTHRPRITPMAGKPKKIEAESDEAHTKYVLLSSSPAKLESDFQDEPPEDSKDDNSANETASPSKQPPPPFTSTAGFRAASTFHNTSIGQLQARNAAPKKALGMRRPMQGWSVKHTQPPRPRQP